MNDGDIVVYANNVAEQFDAATKANAKAARDLRRELLDAVTAGILRAPATIGITVDPVDPNTPSWVGDSVPFDRQAPPDLDEPYRRASVGLKDALTRATTMQISSTPTIGSMDALSGGERQVKLAPKKPEVPMAPPAGRRKIRLDD